MPNNKETKYVDQLTPDSPIPGQLWACLSFLSPEGVRNCSVRGLKIRGVFATREEAEKHAKTLSESDIFHVFVGEVGKWLPWDPNPNDAEDQVYQEEELQKLMYSYKQNQEKAKKMQQQRKSDMIHTATQDEDKKSETQQRLRKKLEERKQKKMLENKLSSKGNVPLVNNELEKKEMLAKQEKDRLNETKKNINEKKEALESIDNKLEKIQALYSKLHEKSV